MLEINFMCCFCKLSMFC